MQGTEYTRWKEKEGKVGYIIIHLYKLDNYKKERYGKL